MVWRGSGDERLAKSLCVLLDQIDARWPNRDRTSDGTIGDTRHQRGKSDHNPNPEGVVTALDITNDPANGPKSGDLAEKLRTSRDPRIKYIISNGHICASYATEGARPWTWRQYHGSNPHDHHVHISVVGDHPALYDSTKPWDFESAAVLTFPKKKPERFTNIMASEFGGGDEAGMDSAYGGKVNPAQQQAALPARIPEDKRKIRVINLKNGKSVICWVNDVGPWNGITAKKSDPYWETGTRPQAESGRDLNGRATNLAGIDLTPAVFDALGIPGDVNARMARVDWEFVA